MFCQKFKQHAINRDRGMLIRLRCKQWSCDYCAEINCYKWRIAMKERITITGAGGWSLLTITARGRAHKHGITLDNLMKNGDKLFKRLRRAWGNFDYVRVYEKHKSGAFHMHILARVSPSDIDDAGAWQTYGKRLDDGTIVKGKRYRGAGHRTLKKASFGVGLGYICDFSPIDVSKADDDNHAVNLVIHYITKYLTKALQALFPKGVRRVICSSKFKLNKPDVNDAGAWQMISQIPYTDILILGTVRDIARKRIITIELYEALQVGALPIHDETY